METSWTPPWASGVGVIRGGQGCPPKVEAAGALDAAVFRPPDPASAPVRAGASAAQPPRPAAIKAMTAMRGAPRVIVSTLLRRYTDSDPVGRRRRGKGSRA